MYVCSACGAEFEQNVGRSGESDTRFDIFCPECGAGVIPDGDAEEFRRQREAQRQILTELRDLAEETQTPSYEGEQYPIDTLKEDLERLLTQIESELSRRKQE